MKWAKLYVVACGALGLLWAFRTGTAAEAQRQALEFSGGNYVSAALNAALDADCTLEAWVCATAQPNLQERIVALAGPEGALQICINGRFIMDNEGGPTHGVAGAAPQNDGLWHHVAIRRYEKTTYAFSIDGRDAGQSPGTTPVYNALYIGTAPGKPGFRGYVDEVRVYNRCLAVAEIFDNYTGEKPVVTDGLVGWWKLDGDAKDSAGNQNGQFSGAAAWVAGRGKALFNKPRISAAFYPEAGKVSVDVDARMMGDFAPEAAWEVILRKPAGEQVARQTAPLLAGTGGGSARTNALGVDEFIRSTGSLAGAIHIPAEKLAPGQYEVQVRILGAQEKPLVDTASEKVTVTERPAWVSKVKILNNLVWELFSAPARIAAPATEFTFTNPRESWVFFTTTAEGDLSKEDSAQVVLDSFPQNKALIRHAEKMNRTQEAMRFLPAGEHRLTVTLKGKAALAGLTVRTIPELAFDEYMQPHNIFRDVLPPRDVAFMKRIGMLDNLTTLQVHGGYAAPPPYWKEWHDAGKRWILGAPIGDDKEIDAAVDRWLGPLKNDWVDGSIVDEFMRFDEFRTAAMKKLLADPRLKGKRFYPYTCSALPERGGAEAAKLLGAVMAAGQLPAWERYLQEQASEGACWQALDASLREDVKQYWRPIRPDAMQRTMLVLGNFLSSAPESLNVHPGVDCKVWMDMQYNLLANDPLFFGLAGIMEYTSGYADEESIRWAARLFRHYAIEGRTEMLSPKYGFKFRLTHIRNADFDDGLKGWDVRAAEQGSVDARSFPGFGGLQGRYPPTGEGNNLLRMKRSAKSPNAVSQTVTGLVPGKLYSVKLFAADYGEMTSGKSRQQTLSVGLTIAGAELLAEKSFQGAFAKRGSGISEAFAGDNPLWVNYFSRVFRATGTEAKLTISDWLSDTVIGGPAGQEIACNFVELQPYLED